MALGDSGVAEVLQHFASIVRRLADTCGGRIINQIGDAFMLVFERPRDAIPFGLAVMRECREDPDLPLLHVGAHHGALLHRDGDYFGNAVNLAARVASSSDSGQFLVTDAWPGSAASAMTGLASTISRSSEEPRPASTTRDSGQCAFWPHRSVRCEADRLLCGI